MPRSITPTCSHARSRSARQNNTTIIKEINTLAPEISRRRAAVISRTEVHASAVNAIDASLKYKLIEVRTKTWWNYFVRATRGTWRDLPYDQSFKVGGSQLKFPGD